MGRSHFTIGQKINYLTILGRVSLAKDSHVLLLCLCSCGNDTIGKATLIRRGKKQSCGCIKTKIHNPMRHLPEFQVWEGMKKRCLNSKQISYKYYGGRGISVCKRWGSFKNFLTDMGPRPTSKHTLERKNNKGNYTPINCKWATREEQSYNRSTTRFVTIGNETKTIGQWVNLHNLNWGCLYGRLKANWSEDRLLLPIGQAGRRNSYASKYVIS
jgi:hypothetical protein